MQTQLFLAQLQGPGVHSTGDGKSIILAPPGGSQRERVRRQDSPIPKETTLGAPPPSLVFQSGKQWN